MATQPTRIETLKQYLDNFENLKNKYSKTVFNKIYNDIIEIRNYYMNNRTNEEIFKELKKTFNEYGWGDTILDSFLQDDIEEFNKKIKDNKDIIVKELKKLESSIKKLVKKELKNDITIENFDKLLLLIEANDSVIMEYKEYLNIYIKSGDFKSDLKSGIFDNNLDVLKIMIEQINKRLISYKIEKNVVFDIEIRRQNDLLVYDEITKLQTKTNGGYRIDITYYSDIQKKFYAADVTANTDGTVDKKDDTKTLELSIVEHRYLQYKQILEHFQKNVDKDIKGEYIFRSNILISKSRKVFSPLTPLYALKQKQDDENIKLKNKTIETILQFVMKNWHISNKDIEFDDLNKFRQDVSTPIEYMDSSSNSIYTKNNLVLSNTMTTNMLGLLSSIKTEQEFINVFTEILNNDYSNPILKENQINPKELLNFFNFTKSIFNFVQRHNSEKYNFVILSAIFDAFALMLNNKDYKKFLNMELYLSTKFELLPAELILKINNDIFETSSNGSYLLYIYDIEPLVSKKIVEKQLNQTNEQLNQTNKQLNQIEEKRIDAILKTIYLEVNEIIGLCYKMKRIKDEEMKEEYKEEIELKIKKINEQIETRSKETEYYIETIGMIKNKEKQKEIYFLKNEYEFENKIISQEEYELKKEQSKKYDKEVFNYINENVFNKLKEQAKIKKQYERYLKVELSLNIVLNEFLIQNKLKSLTDKQIICLKEIKKEIDLFKQQKILFLSSEQENRLIIRLLFNNNLAFNNHLSIDNFNKYVKSFLFKYSSLTHNKSNSNQYSFE